MALSTGSLSPSRCVKAIQDRACLRLCRAPVQRLNLSQVPGRAGPTTPLHRNR